MEYSAIVLKFMLYVFNAHQKFALHNFTISSQYSTVQYSHYSSSQYSSQEVDEEWFSLPEPGFPPSFLMFLNRLASYFVSIPRGFIGYVEFNRILLVADKPSNHQSQRILA